MGFKKTGDASMSGKPFQPKDVDTGKTKNDTLVTETPKTPDASEKPGGVAKK